MGCSRLGSFSKPGRPAAAFDPPLSPSGAIPGWRGQDGGIRLGGGSVDEFLAGALDEVSSHRRAGAEERSLLGTGEQMEALPLGSGCSPAFCGAEGVERRWDRGERSRREGLGQAGKVGERGSSSPPRLGMVEALYPRPVREAEKL